MRQAHEPFARFHIEHVIPRQHGGKDDASNLALACYHCNLHKGPNLAGVDPLSREIVPLFHPRTDRWDEHLAVREGFIEGLTPKGRATVQVLNMNAADRLDLRYELADRGDL
ncbi:MAG: HNH endonuclease signature motif containing protein [Planctomycetota bacterium]